MSTPRFLGLSAVLLALGAIVDIAVGSTPVGFSAGVGFFGSVALVMGSKWLGRHLLSRPEAYYAETDEPAAKAGGQR